MFYGAVPTSLYSAANTLLPRVATPSCVSDAAGDPGSPRVPTITVCAVPTVAATIVVHLTTATIVPDTSADAVPDMPDTGTSDLSADGAWPHLHSAEHAGTTVPNIAAAAMSALTTAAIVPGDSQSTVPDSLRLGLPDLRA